LPASLGARQRDATKQHEEDEHHLSAYPIPPANPAQMMASFNAIALLATDKLATSKTAGDVRCSTLCGLKSDVKLSPRRIIRVV
jgi:hypothetical protein